MNPTEVEILLVEDNPDHAALTRRVLLNGNIFNNVHWVKNGQEALDFLFRRDGFAEAPRPGLVLLDINLPKLNGLEVLKTIKETEGLRVIPVVMLTTSERGEEVNKSYNMGANSFIVKPVSFKEFSEKIGSLKRYWLMVNRGPEFDFS